MVCWDRAYCSVCRIVFCVHITPLLLWQCASSDSLNSVAYIKPTFLIVNVPEHVSSGKDSEYTLKFRLYTNNAFKDKRKVEEVVETQRSRPCFPIKKTVGVTDIILYAAD